MDEDERKVDLKEENLDIKSEIKEEIDERNTYGEEICEEGFSHKWQSEEVKDELIEDITVKEEASDFSYCKQNIKNDQIKDELMKDIVAAEDTINFIDCGPSIKTLQTEDATSEQASPSTSEEYCIHLFLQIIDKIVTELRNHLGKNNSIMKGIGSLDPRSDTFLNISVLKPFAKYYKCNMDSIEAEAQLAVHVKTWYEDKEHKKIGTLLEFASLLHNHQIAFQELYKLSVIAITFPPLSSAGAERTFSCMKNLKTYLRNQMGNAHLFDLAVLAVKSDMAKKLNLDIVVNKFAGSHQNKRIQLI